jgi:hypothetical protein
MALSPCPACIPLDAQCAACRIKADHYPTISMAAQVGYVLTYRRDDRYTSMSPIVDTDYVFMDQGEAEDAAKTKTREDRKDYDGAWDTPKWPPFVYAVRGAVILFIGNDVFTLDDKGAYKKAKVFRAQKKKEIPGLGSEDEMDKKPAKKKSARSGKEAKNKRPTKRSKTE